MVRASLPRAISLVVLGFAAVSFAACGFNEYGHLPPGSGGGGGSAEGSGGASTSGSSGGQGCSGSMVLCDGTCIDTTKDPLHCGKCSTACETGQICENSSCKTSSTCNQGDKQVCYSGPMGTEGMGACKTGLSTCLGAGLGFGPCMGEVLPTTEVCGNMIDEDCNGVAEEGSACLVSQDLVVRYFLDEAASGQAPAAALDSAPNPRDLAIAYTSQLTYTAAGTGRGLAWSANDGNGVVTTTTDNTKILTMLEGKVEATIEVVAKIDGVAGNFDRIVTIGTNTDNRFTLGTDNIGGSRLRLDLNNVESSSWFPNFIGARAVFHLVMNNADANANNRVRLFLNGTLQTNTSTSPPGQNTVINIGAGRSLTLGNREISGRSMRGVLYYAAIYSRALTDAEIANNVGILSANDDK